MAESGSRGGGDEGCRGVVGRGRESGARNRREKFGGLEVWRFRSLEVVAERSGDVI